MPLVDMPLEELKSYQGISPKPSDFDSYWSESLNELESVNPDIELIEADFQVPGFSCCHLYFNGVGGARIHAKLIKPVITEKSCSAVLRFHGYRCNCGDWFELLPYAVCGSVVASLDCRGQSGLSEDNLNVKGNTVQGHIIRGLVEGPEKLLYRQVYLDAVLLARIVMDMQEVDEKRVAATGWSQGGALAIACAALEPGINRTAPVYPFLSDFKRAWQLDFCTGVHDEIREYFRWFDPLHEKENEIFEKLGYIDVQNLADRVRGKVLFSASLRDDCCPPSTQFAIYNKIIADKKLNVYHDFSHELLRGCHDRILQFILEM